MPRKRFRVNDKVRFERVFQMTLFRLLVTSYGERTAEFLCIKRRVAFLFQWPGAAPASSFKIIPVSVASQRSSPPATASIALRATAR